ncbi:hypothetical protein [Kaarinaea lacus]
MPDQLKFLENQNVIQIKTFGHTNIDDMRRSLVTVSEIAEQKNVWSVIVNAQELDSLPDISEIYQFVADLPSKLKLAIVVPEPKGRKNIEEMSKIFEVQTTLETFKNIGNTSEKNIKLFNTCDEALDWLATSPAG